MSRKSVDTKIMDMQIEKDDTQNRDSQKDIEHENKVNDLKSNASKHVSFDTEIVKDDKDVHCSDPPSVADKDSLMSGQVVTCCGGSGGSKFFPKQQSDTDEYEDNDCSDNEVTQIPCSQIRDVPHMLQRQNACCNLDNFDKPYKPMNLTHLDNRHEDNTEQDEEEEEEEEEEGKTDGNGTGEDSNNG